MEEQFEENENGDESKSTKTIAGFVREEREVPNLTVKEKKELGSYANSLGDKLKCQQVGKSGVTDNVIFALSETLEKRELLKLKIHKSCPGEIEDVVSQVERGTGSVAVFQIGRIVIFYRPSITKMKAEEKKEQNRRLFAQKKKRAQTAFMMNRRQPGKRPGQGYRGSRQLEKSPS